MPRESSGNILGPPHLDFEMWKELIRTIGGRFNPEGIDRTAFTGSARPISVCGLTAAEVGSNAHRVERTHRDVRLDGADHYVEIFHAVNRSAMTRNGRQTPKSCIQRLRQNFQSRIAKHFTLDNDSSCRLRR